MMAHPLSFEELSLSISKDMDLASGSATIDLCSNEILNFFIKLKLLEQKQFRRYHLPDFRNETFTRTGSTGSTNWDIHFLVRDPGILGRLQNFHKIVKEIDVAEFYLPEQQQMLPPNPNQSSPKHTDKLAIASTIRSDQSQPLLRDSSEMGRALGEANFRCCCCFCSPSTTDVGYDNSAPGLHAVASQNKVRLGLNSSSPLAADSDIRFIEVSALASGINHVGLSYGGAWGDVNGDSYPDLWLNNHFRPQPLLYLNLGNGTFTNSTSKIISSLPSYNVDWHGTAWADFDNDGDQDLANVVGTFAGDPNGPQNSNRFFVNNEGILEDRSTAVGVVDTRARARGLLWFDFNKDGLLDLAEGVVDSPGFPVKFFQQKPDGIFEDATLATGIQLSKAEYFLSSDLSGDGNLDLIIDSGVRISIYDTTTLPFINITSAIIPDLKNTKGGNDIVSADFNGDLLPDLYVTRGSFGGLIGTGLASVSDLYQNDINKVTATIRNGDERTERGLQFEATGEVTIEIGGYYDSIFDTPISRKLSEVFIGARGIHPSNVTITRTNYAFSAKFTLSTDDSMIVGSLPHIPSVDKGIYISYDPTLNRWQMLLSGEATLFAKIESINPINDLAAIGFIPNPTPVGDTLLINTPQGLIDNSEAAGINSIPTPGAGVVAGDFDNDMDQDIYIVTSRAAVNSPNILYENQGDGTFIALPDAAGAAGTEVGFGDLVITADYDLDGFLDLLVANGPGEPNLLNREAPNQLFRNQGNGNHWLQIDLQGQVSNRDGIGSKVFLTADGVTQLREQAGGIHNNVQNHSRIHFGIAGNTQVQELVINWPSERVQRITNLPVNRLIRVIEAGGTGSDLIVGTTSNDVATGEGGNDTLQGQDGGDHLNGSIGNDWLDGGNGNDTMIGGNGNDFLFGRAGLDSLVGGRGNDFYEVDTAGDVVVEAAGEGSSDTVQSFVSYVLPTAVENLELQGLASLNGTGNTLNNRIIGNSKNNTLTGDRGNDTLVGRDVNDTLIGGFDKDFLSGNSGSDSFTYTVLSESLLASFDVITDYAGAGSTPDRLNAPESIVPITLSVSRGTAANLSATAIQAVFTNAAFGANTVAAFQVTGQSGTFIAFNNGTAGFQPTTDSIIHLEAYTISVANPVVLI
jgi:Ca2+-binding RTX toxin-like protein